jgi:hypothetical protein
MKKSVIQITTGTLRNLNTNANADLEQGYKSTVLYITVISSVRQKQGESHTLAHLSLDSLDSSNSKGFVVEVVVVVADRRDA